MTRIPRIRSLALLRAARVPLQLLAQDPQVVTLQVRQRPERTQCHECGGGESLVCDVELYRDGRY